MPSVTVTGEAERDSGYRAKRSDSATGLSLGLRETPQSVSVITRTQLDDFGITSVNDALELAPGIRVERVESDRTYYTARGFDVTNFQLDGIGMPFSNGAQWGDLDLAVYERVDVLRGANGLMSSTGFPSATINFVRKKPTADFRGSAALTLGSWDRKRVEADVSGGLNAAKTVRGRLIAAVDDGDSYLDRQHRRTGTLYGVVDIDLAPTTVLSIGHLAQRTKTDAPLWGALPTNHSDGSPTDYDRSTSTAADWAWWTNTDQRTHVELTHEVGSGWQLRSVLTHRRAKSDSELFYVYGTPDPVTGAGLLAYPSAFEGKYTQDMINVQATGPFKLGGREHQATFGASTAREKADELSGYPTSVTDPLPSPLEDWDGSFVKPPFDAYTRFSDWTTKRYTAFAAARWSVADSWKLITGANLTRVKSDGENYGTPHRYTATKTSPYIGVIYDVTPDLALYASHTRIFSPQTELDRAGNFLPAVRGHSTEVGAKAAWLNDQLVTNVALFDIHQDGLADSGTFDVDLGRSYYTPENDHSQGIELEAVGRVVEGLELSGNVTHFKLTNDDGIARPYLPRTTARLAVGWKATAQLKLSAAARWQSEFWSRDSGYYARQGAYATLDASASWKFHPRWTAALHLNNLTDRKAWNSLYWSQAFYNAPRNGRVTLSTTF